MVVCGSACEAASCTSLSGTPASSAAVMNACRSVCVPDALDDPGPAGSAADDPSGAVSVQPDASRGQEDRPVCAFANGEVDRPSGARRERNGDNLAALAGDHQGPVPAFDAQGLDVGAAASETRSPLSASSEISACSAGGPSPAATSRAPSSLRSSPMAWDS
jgi:hypothetical protein